MKRVNRFEVRPRCQRDRELLLRLLDASASLWNEVTYARQQRHFNDEGYEDETVFDADTGVLEGQYKPVLSSSTAQQIIHKNSQA